MCESHHYLEIIFKGIYLSLDKEISYIEKEEVITWIELERNQAKHFKNKK